MSDAPALSRANPWTALWFRPRAAIDAVIATQRGTLTLLIALTAALVGVIAASSESFGLFGSGLDQQALVLVAGLLLAVVVIALIGYFVNGWILNVAAHALGGRGDAFATRAASAWSSVPLLVANLFALAISGFAGAHASTGLAFATSTVVVIASLWSTILVVTMLARVQTFGAWRAFFSLIIGSVAPALVLALAIRCLLFQPFNVPSGSMAPTLQVGDYFFAAKADYGYSRYSFPFDLIAFEGRLFAHAPKRGDVVVFRHRGADWVKRIVGLPGEKIQLKAGRLYIDGQLVERRPVEPGFSLVDPAGKPMPVPTFDELLPGGAVHRILQLQGDGGGASNTQVYETPAGAYFVLGDNRDNSMDSRMTAVGFVPFEDLIGRADLIYYSLESDAETHRSTLRFERVGMGVR